MSRKRQQSSLRDSRILENHGCNRESATRITQVRRCFCAEQTFARLQTIFFKSWQRREWKEFQIMGKNINIASETKGCILRIPLKVHWWSTISQLFFRKIQQDVQNNCWERATMITTVGINDSRHGRWNISFNGAFKTLQGAPRGQVRITNCDNGGVFPSFDHLVKFVPREGSARRTKRKTTFQLFVLI